MLLKARPQLWYRKLNVVLLGLAVPQNQQKTYAAAVLKGKRHREDVSSSQTQSAILWCQDAASVAPVERTGKRTMSSARCIQQTDMQRPDQYKFTPQFVAQRQPVQRFAGMWVVAHVLVYRLEA